MWKIDALAYLISKGGDIFARTIYFDTPLHYAAAGGSMNCMELLIKNGADVNATDEVWWFPLFLSFLFFFFFFLSFFSLSRSLFSISPLLSLIYLRRMWLPSTKPPLVDTLMWWLCYCEKVYHERKKQGSNLPSIRSSSGCQRPNRNVPLAQCSFCRTYGVHRYASP